MKVDRIRRILEVHKELDSIARSLHRLDEYQCNYGELTDKQARRETRLEKRAKELSKEFGLHIYRQSDPRGASLYLTDNKEEKYLFSHTHSNLALGL